MGRDHVIDVKQTILFALSGNEERKQKTESMSKGTSSSSTPHRHVLRAQEED